MYDWVPDSCVSQFLLFLLKAVMLLGETACLGSDDDVSGALARPTGMPLAPGMPTNAGSHGGAVNGGDCDATLC